MPAISGPYEYRRDQQRGENDEHDGMKDDEILWRLLWFWHASASPHIAPPRFSPFASSRS
jgi:hypothetical protein